MKPNIILNGYSRSRHQIVTTYSIKNLKFHTSRWYNDVDLLELEAKFGRPLMEKIYFQMMAFGMMKFGSLLAQTIDFGEFSQFCTKSFCDLWTAFFRHSWGDWRYVNNQPHYQGPEFLCQPRSGLENPITLALNPTEILFGNGGGKDSLSAMQLLKMGDIPFSTLVYSHSRYGPSEHQHNLNMSLSKQFNPVQSHKIWVYDDFVDSPILELYPELNTKSIKVCEVINFIMDSLPVILFHGYQHLVVANERSADTENLEWKKTGEKINHQWGKSLDAEVLIDEYIRREFFANFSYFSLIKPLYDPVIFGLCSENLPAVLNTHSCNVQKPWCRQCPKCAYVWANYMAYFPEDLVNSIFKINLFDVEENLLFFRQLLGLEQHRPFECVGEIDETRLAFELCRLKGITGKAMDLFVNNVHNFEIQKVADKYLMVEQNHCHIPIRFQNRVLPHMHTIAESLRQMIYLNQKG